MLERRVVERFWSRVEKGAPEECWPWQGTRLPTGYGTFSVPNGRRGSGIPYYAHRVAYEAQIDLIPKGMFVCHHCDNPPCCNWRHLFVGMHSDNMRDMWGKGRGVLTLPPTPFGEDHPAAKLDAAKVAAIRELRSRGLLLDEIAARIGVGKSTVSRVINRDAVGGWSHV